MDLRDTIVAISTPAGRGGLGVVRVSGEQARSVAEGLLRFPSSHDWKPWTAALADLVGEDGGVVDSVVATYFAAPRSYTSEDVVEISCHGSPVVLRFAVERAVAAGARLAEPGEFTLRAYVNGRIDLPRAEAVRDLIDATTLYQARVAAQQIGGSVSRRIQPIKTKLLELIALLEAGIDFADDDVSIAPDEEILRRIAGVQEPVRRLIASFAYGKLVHDGFAMAIVGKPNVGKSSLFNRLLERDRAIVTDIPGTTRDLISESASIDGLPVRFLDTAGIRRSGDVVESLGIERSYQAIADADLTLVVLDLSRPLDDEDRGVVGKAKESGRFLVVGNKADLPRELEFDGEFMGVSATTGQGIAELRRRIVETMSPAGEAQEPGFLTSLRHEQLLRETDEALTHARLAVASHIPHEMLLLDLYAALHPIDAVTGATTADDILNRIFSTFCIGK